MIPDSVELADFAVAGISRCYRRAHQSGWASITPETNAIDVEALRFMWALSNRVLSLAQRVTNNPRALAKGISSESIVEFGRISGALDARSTHFEQIVSGDLTRFVSEAPAVTHATRRNHVLGWVLREAERFVLSLVRQGRLGPEYEWVHLRASQLESALRTKVLRDTLGSPVGRTRPNSAAIRDCKKALNAIYRDAASAFESLAALEAQDTTAVSQIISDTVVSRLENWQLLELCTVVAVASAIHGVTGAPVRWRNSFSATPSAQVGEFSVVWQHSVPTRDSDQLDPSENLIRSLLSSLGVSTGAGRADATVQYRGIDLCHIECKWFESPGAAASAIADATAQLVRYARDSRPATMADATAMLRDSLIVCASTNSFDCTVDGQAGINLVDFRALKEGILESWAVRLVGAATDLARTAA